MSEYDRESSTMGRPLPTRDCHAMEEKITRKINVFFSEGF